MSYKSLPIAGAVMLATGGSIAQVPNVCATVYANAVTTRTDYERDYSYNEYVFNNYCNADGSTRNFNLDTAGEAIIQGIPFKGSLGITDPKTQWSSFCQKYADFKSTAEYVSFQQIVPDTAALRSFNDCMYLLQQGIEVSHVYDPETPDIATIRIGFDPTQRTVKLSSIAVSGNVDCSTNDLASNPVLLKGNKAYKLKGTTLITCSRKPAAGYGGGQSFLPAGAQLGLNTLTYSMTMPAEGINGPALVSEARAQRIHLEQALAAAEKNLATAKKRWDGKSVKVGHIFRSSEHWQPGGVLFIGCDNAANYYDRICPAPPGTLRQVDTVYSNHGGVCGHTLITVTCIKPGT
jgi:hypothetical protein